MCGGCPFYFLCLCQLIVIVPTGQTTVPELVAQNTSMILINHQTTPAIFMNVLLYIIRLTHTYLLRCFCTETLLEPCIEKQITLHREQKVDTYTSKW